MQRNKYLRGEKTDFEGLRKASQEEYEKALAKMVEENKVMASPHYDTFGRMGLIHEPK
jgi:hypothetical protein